MPDKQLAFNQLGRGRLTQAHTFIHMNAVIEVSHSQAVVHANPFNWFCCAEAGTKRSRYGAVQPKSVMTIHAGTCWRQSRRRGGSTEV